MLIKNVKILCNSHHLLHYQRKLFSISTDSLLISFLAAASTGISTYFIKQRQIDRLKNEFHLRQYQINDLETQLSTAKSIEDELKTSKNELAQQILTAMELRATNGKLDALLISETNSRQKAETECVTLKENLKLLESNLAGINSKYVDEMRRFSECQARLESVQAIARSAKDQAENEKEARTNLEKTIETSLKINIERIREDLISKTRQVVEAGVIETLRSSLRQTPVLGRFGEIQLEYLLREYFTLGEMKLYDQQVTLQSKKRLDAVLKLPTQEGTLHIIIDAKTPNIFHPDTSGPSDSVVLVTQLRNRISDALTTLSKADYVEHYRRHLASKKIDSAGGQVCDFVLMFVPMDYALLAVDEKLLRKCLDAKVIVCTPSLLGLQIEFIKMAWRQKLPSDALAHVEQDFTLLTDSMTKLNKDLERCGSSLKMATIRAEKASDRLKNSLAGIFENSVEEND